MRGRSFRVELLLYIVRSLEELLDLVHNIDEDIEDVSDTMTDISQSVDALLAEVTTEIDQATATLQARIDALEAEKGSLSQENQELLTQLTSSVQNLNEAKGRIDAKTEELRANNPTNPGDQPHPDQTLPGDLPPDTVK